MTRFFSLLLMLLLSGFAQPSLATEADGATGVKQLRQFLSNLITLQAEFVQTLRQPDSDQIYITSGILYLQRPGRFRWQYDAPSRQLIIADGNRIWLHDRELEQVSHRDQQAALKGTPAQLLSDTGPIERHFAITELGQKDGIDWLSLKPKQKDVEIDQVKLGLKQNQLVQMEMIDSFGQITRFRFSNLQRNPALEHELFVFDPPDGIDMIGDL
ncbi:outer membrane lipoprotein chaperone LolA [Candidatus Endoriftia persephonae]|jgi:outer membrane lipoprotein carrier protein|uniref:Outer-membrane lipoprotein carrier protein n=2 Tax=Gammaproteobacteria TaxID=1236 RepID=G2FE71_9GAMM|nr:outer membrane lipoprotein chaperone LolA [Candidatus Endoriftia persephone]EGW54841.1 outer-membrane lipoprotein carrier protein [endosymbiont of Tevnia jerichonana (vent Tica)]USF86128.1 outer membrane lipoprotein chaperone LolA [Candidatus Endoriftia persephone]